MIDWNKPEWIEAAFGAVRKCWRETGGNATHYDSAMAVLEAVAPLIAQDAKRKAAMWRSMYERRLGKINCACTFEEDGETLVRRCGAHEQDRADARREALEEAARLYGENADLTAKDAVAVEIDAFMAERKRRGEAG